MEMEIHENKQQIMELRKLPIYPEIPKNFEFFDRKAVENSYFPIRSYALFRNIIAEERKRVEPQYQGHDFFLKIRTISYLAKRIHFFL